MGELNGIPIPNPKLNHSGDEQELQRLVDTERAGWEAHEAECRAAVEALLEERGQMLDDVYQTTAEYEAQIGFTERHIDGLVAALHGQSRNPPSVYDEREAAQWMEGYDAYKR